MKKLYFVAKGIGLLELLLSIALISAILITSIRYYSTAKSKQEATELVNSYGTIRSAVENYIVDNPVSDVTPSMSDLIQGGYLPKSFGYVSGSTATVNDNIWAGDISISYPGNNSVLIQQSNIPHGICEMAIAQIQATLGQNESVSISQTNSTTSGCSSSEIVTLYVTYDL